MGYLGYDNRNLEMGILEKWEYEGSSYRLDFVFFEIYMYIL